MNIYRLFIAIFELLTFLVLSGLFTGYLLLNKRKGDALRPLPFKTVLVSMLSFAASGLCSGVYNAYFIRNFEATTASVAAELISEALMLIAVDLLFYGFFAMAHTYGEQIISQSKIWPRMRIVHWILLSLFVALSIVEWSWYVYSAFGGIPPRGMPNPYWIWTQLLTARWIVFWVGSWEILGAFIVMGIQTSTRTSHMRMSTYFAVISGSLFLGLNGLWAVWSINSYLKSVVPPTGTAIFVREIIQFFFAIGTYFGLGLCFWRFPSQVAIDQKDDLWIKSTRRLGPVEADSRKVLPEADTSRPVLEADGTNPILEADSKFIHERP